MSSEIEILDDSESDHDNEEALNQHTMRIQLGWEVRYVIADILDGFCVRTGIILDDDIHHVIIETLCGENDGDYVGMLA
jgi:hypothetical protein